MTRPTTLVAGRLKDVGIRQLRLSTEILGLIAVAIVLGFVLQRLAHANLSVLFLFIALIVAARHGLWPSIVTSLLGFLAFNFFFTSPYRTFAVAEQGDIATLMFFLASAIIGGNLASGMRVAIQRRDAALERISNLYDFLNRIAGATTSDEILRTLVDHLSTTLAAEVEIVDDGDGTRGSGWLLLDVDSKGMGISRLAVHRPELSEEQIELVENLCAQAKVAFDRVRLTEDLESSRREAERARLRSALLTSVSHDLRTPLASIIGAASSVQELGDSINAANRSELLNTVMSEARRLNGYIQNLLDMTRIEHGELRLQRDWEEPADLIQAATHRIRETWPDAQFAVRILPDTGLVRLHGELFVQALYNVIDNAARFSPAGAPIEIVCSSDGNTMRFEITDSGRGIEPNDRERIFDMLYRAESGDSQIGGTGLGLAITRGILEAHGGQAFAERAPGSNGTRIVLQLPVDVPQDQER